MERERMQVPLHQHLVHPIGEVVVKLQPERLHELIEQDREDRDRGQEHEDVLESGLPAF